MLKSPIEVSEILLATSLQLNTQETTFRNCVKTVFDADFNPAAVSIPGFFCHLFYQEQN